MTYHSPRKVESTFHRLSLANPDTAAVDLRLAVALELGITEDAVCLTLGNELWRSLRDMHDREVKWRRDTNRVGWPL